MKLVEKLDQVFRYDMPFIFAQFKLDNEEHYNNITPQDIMELHAYLLSKIWADISNQKQEIENLISNNPNAGPFTERFKTFHSLLTKIEKEFIDYAQTQNS